jgi:epsilon-lactone hydrolase
MRPPSIRERAGDMTDVGIAELRKIIAANPLPNDLAELRKAGDADAERFPLDANFEVDQVVINNVPAEWTSSPGADRTHVLLYLHGGGFVFGSILSHRHLVAEIGRLAGCRTLAIDYRLAPEHPFPAPVEDAVAAYRFLLADGIDPRHIAIAGDSAGGGLVVSTLVALKEVGLVQPACAWVISPWVDMEALGETFTTLADVDPMVKKSIIDELAVTYLNGASPRSPLASPIHADLRDIAPLLIHVGAAEVLLDDALKLAQRAGAANVPVRLEVWPEMVHIWHVFHRILKEGHRAVEAGSNFIRSAMAG